MMYKALHSNRPLHLDHYTEHGSRQSAVRAPRMLSRSKFMQGSGARKLAKAFQIRQQRPARAAASHTSTVCRQVQKVTAEELEVAIQTRDRPLVIDFYATWCGPCLLLAKELEQVYDELGDEIRILKIDTDENPDLSSQLQIQGLPTMVFVGIDPSKPALRTEGLLPAASIKEIIQGELLPQTQTAGSAE